MWCMSSFGHKRGAHHHIQRTAYAIDATSNVAGFRPRQRIADDEFTSTDVKDACICLLIPA